MDAGTLTDGRNWWQGMPLRCAPELRACLRRICSWRNPPNWGPTDWWEEIGTVAAIAAWDAERVFDSCHGISVNTFVRYRVLACALARYRQEWAYATRCVFNPALEEEDGSFCRGDGFFAPAVQFNPACDALLEALAEIPATSRCLIRQLFWEERTQAEIGREQGISQRAVSKRKQAALRSLSQRLNLGTSIRQLKPRITRITRTGEGNGSTVAFIHKVMGQAD